MKNRFLKIVSIIFFYFIFLNAYSSEQFNFNVTEIQILENGNKFIGTKRGEIKSDNGVTINADYFEYNKNSNILKAKGKVKIIDDVNNSIILTNKITYNKNKNIIYTEGDSKAISLDDDIIIKANYFEYKKDENIIIAKKNVIIENKIENYQIFSEHIKYLKDEEKITTIGKTSAAIHSKYNFKSSDVVFLKKAMELSSQKKTSITDKVNIYKLGKFKYLINKEELKGEKIIITTNFKLPKSDTFYFSNAIINLKNQNFVAKDTKIKIHKDIFNNKENDPRIKGVSSIKKGDLTIINKGVFTSCKETDSCPPWAIEAREVKHDKIKKQLIYKNAILKVYDYPVLYFPHFFHPDPTVNRQSGILKPVLNNSNVLGSSFTIPYYHVISDDSDITSTPTIFDSNMKMLQNEYRKVGQNYDLLTNFGHTRGYKSSTSNKKKNISYLFTKLNLDFDLESFNSSKMYLNFEKTTNDSFLKVFETNLLDNSTSLKPSNPDTLSSEIKFVLSHRDYNLNTGFQMFEDMQLKNNDRYEYVLPYYDFNKILFPNYKYGLVSLNSNGDNNLNNTNQLKSRIINNLSFSSLDFISNKGIKNNLNLNLKNLNSVGKNVADYKSSPQIELSSIFELQSTLPLKKEDEYQVNYLTPKLSIRVNPSDMKNYGTSERSINTDNIFSLDRLGLGDSFEAGKSLTLGLDYRREMIENINKYFEFKLATVVRDKEETFIPSNTTINKKNSNLFGSITNNFSDHLKIDYNFALDNNYEKLEYNDISTSFSVNNFVTSFNFIKENGEMGNENFLQNSTYYEIDENNFINFNTRRNRKLNLTEFYDLVYEYKNDCLTAAIKYKKTYYEDRDLKPTEDLFFSITLFPLTTYEQKIDQ